jgi:hypothetical protein
LSRSSVSFDLSREVRKYIFDFSLEHALAPVLEQIMLRFNLERPTAFQTLLDLQSAHHIMMMPGTQRILMAWPFSSIVTPFKVKLSTNHKEYFANCAWDAVAFHVMLGAELQIDSFCHHCAEEISIHLKDQKKVSARPSGDPLVYLSLPAAKWWDNILLTCSNNMVFFSSQKHLEDWIRLNSSSEGQALTIEQTLELSIPIYRDKMSLGYSRPSREETMSHFRSLGLSGDFWQL